MLWSLLIPRELWRLLSPYIWCAVSISKFIRDRTAAPLPFYNSDFILFFRLYGVIDSGTRFIIVNKFAERLEGCQHLLYG